eukprot:903100_1
MIPPNKSPNARLSFVIKICINVRLSSNKILRIVLDLMNDKVKAEAIHDPQDTLSTLKQYDMEWCLCVMQTMRKQVAHAYIMSIENRKCNESKNFVDIDDFCVELVAQAKKAEEYFNRKVDWKILIMFIARFACMKANDTDISFKHWKVDDLQIIDDIEFENILYRHVQLYLH